jgi:hypothetical protein
MRREHHDVPGYPWDDGTGECHRRHGNPRRVAPIWLLMRERRDTPSAKCQIPLAQGEAPWCERSFKIARKFLPADGSLAGSGPRWERRTGWRLRRSLDRAGPGDRRGGDHPCRAAMRWSAARGEIAKEDACRSPDCDNRADDHRSQAAQAVALCIHRHLANPFAYLQRCAVDQAASPDCQPLSGRSKPAISVAWQHKPELGRQAGQCH